MESLITHLRRLFSRVPDDTTRAAQLHVELQTALTAERSRSDRSGLPFTFVVMSIERRMSGTFTHERARQILAEAVQTRTRSIDTTARQGDDLAVIFPYTTAADADAILSSIEKVYTERALGEASSSSLIPRITFDVYSHPERVQEKAEG